MENKTDQDIYFKVHDLIIDGEANDDYEIGNYFEPGEDGTAQLSAFDYDGDLPQMEDSLSFTIKAYNPGNAEPFGSHEVAIRSEEHTSELQSRGHLVCRLLLEKK